MNARKYYLIKLNKHLYLWCFCDTYFLFKGGFFISNSVRNHTQVDTKFYTPIHEGIHEKAVEISTRYKKAEAELIEVLEQVDNHKVYLRRGRSSLFQYGVQDLQLSESVIYNLITVMRKVREVPELKAQIQEGNITLSNARRIAPILTVENQGAWLKKASELSQRQLEKEIVKTHPLSAVIERAGYVTESRVKLETSLSENAMMRLRRVQDLVSQSKSKHASLENTLIEMTEFYLLHKDPVIRAERIYAKKGVANKASRVKPPAELVSIRVETHGSVKNGSAKNESVSDESIINVASVKFPNKREPIPTSILHQVNLRDERRCTYINSEGSKCSQTRWTEIHHRLPLVLGGKNTLGNLTTLCSAHHQWIHIKMDSEMYLRNDAGPVKKL